MALDPVPTYPGNYDANEANNSPSGSETRREGDDQIRRMKASEKSTWSNVTGAVTSSHTELNTLTGINTGSDLETRISTIETQLDVIEPIGTIKPWPIQEASLTQTLTGSLAPGRGTWHLCDGSTLDGSTTYATLYALIANQFGGASAATMQIPKTDGRVIAGRGTGVVLAGYRQGVNDNTQGNTGGEEAHTPVEDEMFQHNHGGGSHSHFANYALGSGTTTFSSGSSFGNNVSTGGNYASSGVSGSRPGYIDSSGATVTNQGSSENANVVQPTIILAYYIRVL